MRHGVPPDYSNPALVTQSLPSGSFPLPASWLRPAIVCLVVSISFMGQAAADDVPRVADVAGQPLAANARRLLEAYDFLGHPWAGDPREAVQTAIGAEDAVAVQAALDPHVLLVVHINPEQRVKVTRGPGAASIVEGGFTPLLVKVINEAAVTEKLRVGSPQAGKAYGGVAELSLQRQQTTELGMDQITADTPRRFLTLEMFGDPPLTPQLSGLSAEYDILLVSSSESGQREATIAFDIGQGTQDLGFRGEAPVLFDITPAIAVPLSIRDVDGSPSIARLTVQDAQGRVYPPQARRLAPDFFFQPYVYRADGETLQLPPGRYTLTASRGPEYLDLTQEIDVSASDPFTIRVELQRWVEPASRGWYSGDHHIHGAGCAHYAVPTQGVTPQDMFRQVKGEGLNVGCVLTWGPCFDFQRRYFGPIADAVSEPLTILKYDLEISGFGSAAMGHVCLLNLTEQEYPGSDGTSTRGWPTWTAPVMRWAKEQGGVTGYPHSDMRIDPEGFAQWKLSRHDANADGLLNETELAGALLPEPLSRIDRDGNRSLTAEELTISADRAANELPNLVLPSMRGAGAMEILVTVPEGVCDFISAMDTGRIGEWNTWYHLLNCGFPVKVSGETDFPCMSSQRVGQGRTYVRLANGPVDQVDFAAWCRGIAAGRAYVSDGYAHALEFSVNGTAPGDAAVELDRPATIAVTAQVAFAPATPVGVAYGTQEHGEGRRETGDTRELHAERSADFIEGGDRLVEIIVDGRVAASANVPADGNVHELTFDIHIERSSWVALRQFPQLHTNPVDVLVADRPIRASQNSARWCAEAVELLWANRNQLIAEPEREAARAAYDRAIAEYQRRAAEAGPTQ